MTITTQGARYHVGTIAELRQLLATLQAAGRPIVAVSGLQRCWYCDRELAGGQCPGCRIPRLTPADWTVIHVA